MTTAAAPPPRRRLARDDTTEPKVSSLELFFDLVFVFAITQVTALMAADPSFRGLGRGLLILALVWWMWSGYAWLTNAVDPDAALSRFVMFSATAAVLVVALAVPGAFSDDGEIFALAYLAVRLLHSWLFWVAAEGDVALRRNIVRLIITSLVGPGLILVATLAFDGTARDAVCIAAILLDYGIVILAPVEGWHVSPGHFAERFGLIMIIALGESIVAVGVGAAELELDLSLVVAAALTVVIAAALWWAYFDVVAVAAERRFRAAPPSEQPRIARDSYALIHLGMIAGIVLFALGVKKATEHLGDPLEDAPAAALCGGLALYALSHVAFRLRNLRTWNRQRVVVAAICLAMIPVATSTDALIVLAIFAALWASLIAYEALHFAEARRRMRAAAARD